MTNIEIANSVKGLKIGQVAQNLGIDKDCVEPYGLFKAKINHIDSKPKAKLVLVTAINPTPAGEGKTTVSIGLCDALNFIGKKTAVALREPSLGPVFGLKGGAAGGGYAQVIPMEEINLHFNGDIHAVSSANNLLCALIDNHIHQGNTLRINPKKIGFKRCVDLNDRALRSIVVGLGGIGNGQMREDGFYITAASEVMAILCLASDLADLKRRLGDILIAYDYDDKPIFCKDLKAENAMAILLKEAIKPNLVQTLEGNPAFIHGGPFANIAHGCSSVIATKTAMNFADFVVTEAGFGADLGAEKFLHIKCRGNGLSPACVVIVATVKALKNHCDFGGGAGSVGAGSVGAVGVGSVGVGGAGVSGIDALKSGLSNLERHIKNITEVFGLRAVVAINKFKTDTDEEIGVIVDCCARHNVKAFCADVFGLGGKGGEDLAREVVAVCEGNVSPRINYVYELDEAVETKIEKVCKNVYGAGKVVFAPKALSDIGNINRLGFGNLPIIIAKTQFSFSDNPKLVGAPSGFKIDIREVQIRSGSGFLVAVAGDIMLMPGLSAHPAAENMFIDENGVVEGLF